MRARAATTIDEAYCALHPEGIPGDYTCVTVSDDGCGRDLAPRVVALRPGVRKLLMSGYAADMTRVGDVPADDVALIQKPFTQSDLVVKIREVLDAEPN